MMFEQINNPHTKNEVELYFLYIKISNFLYIKITQMDHRLPCEIKL